jgi:hypothetical protein
MSRRMRGSSQSNLRMVALNANGFIAGAKQTTVLCLVRRSRRALLADRPSIRGRGRRGHDHTRTCGHHGRLYLVAGLGGATAAGLV